MDRNTMELELAKAVTKKWKPLVESKIVNAETGEETDLGFEPIKGRGFYDTNYRKLVTSKLLENTEAAYIKENGRMLTENVNQSAGIDIQDPILINLVRRLAPNLLAYDLVGVQPMSGPTGLIFALRSFYTSQPQGPFGRPGDARPGHTAGSALDSNGETIAQEWGDAGKAPNEAFYNEADTTFSGTGTQSPNDGTTAYTAYSVGTAMSTFAGETLGRGGSGDAVWKEMGVAIEKKNVAAGERALKARYTYELAQDLQATHGLDAENEITTMLATEIMAEENRELVNRLRQIAKIAPGELKYNNGDVVVDSAGNPILGLAGQFDINVNSDGRYSAEKVNSLLMKISKEANAIAKDTRRGRGNFIICSSNVASALDLAGKLKFTPAADNNLTVDDTGNTFVGTLQNRFKVFIDPYLMYDEVIVGYKGASQLDAGMFWCPYVPLQMYKTLDPNTLAPVLGLKTRYGVVENPFTSIKKNSNTYYRKFKVKGL